MSKLAQPPHPIDTALGATLRQLRQSRGLNQTELGERLGVSLQQIQKYEAGSNRMAASTIYRAAEILGVEVSAVYAGVNRQKTRSSGTTRARNTRVVVIPLAAGQRSARSRETELINVVRNYQAIKSASERALVRKLISRLSPAPARAGST